MMTSVLIALGILQVVGHFVVVYLVARIAVRHEMDKSGVNKILRGFVDPPK